MQTKLFIGGRFVDAADGATLEVSNPADGTKLADVNPGSPFGGVRGSGYGREMGFEAMRDYTESKSVWVNVDAEIPPFYPR